MPSLPSTPPPHTHALAIRRSPPPQVFEHHFNRTGFHIRTSMPDYFERLERTRFCLSPTGGGHGHRQILVAFSGCVPLVISDHVLQPFEPALHWSRFALTLPQVRGGERARSLRCTVPRGRAQPCCPGARALPLALAACCVRRAAAVRRPCSRATAALSVCGRGRGGVCGRGQRRLAEAAAPSSSCRRRQRVWWRARLPRTPAVRHPSPARAAAGHPRGGVQAHAGRVRLTRRRRLRSSCGSLKGARVASWAAAQRRLHCCA